MEFADWQSRNEKYFNNLYAETQAKVAAGDSTWQFIRCFVSPYDKRKFIEYLLSARLEIEKINEMFDLGLPESDEYMTLGGLILHEYQSFPKLNEVVTIGKFEFKIIKNTMTKIELVRLKVAE